jgi:hypothetical protein
MPARVPQITKISFARMPFLRDHRPYKHFMRGSRWLDSAGRLPLMQEASMKQSDHFRENADNCQRLAERAPDHPTYLRYKRMQDAWRSLADEQDWLDGEKTPVPIDF